MQAQQDFKVHSRLTCSCGFTYIWLLLFIAFSGIGLSVAGMSWQYQVRAEKEKQLLFVGAEFRNAINSYYSTMPDTVKSCLTSLNDLLIDKRKPGIKRHLRKIYLDPMTGKADWNFVTQQGCIVGIFSRSTLTPYKKKGFNLADAQLAGAKNYKEWVFSISISNNLKSPEEISRSQQSNEVLGNDVSAIRPSVEGRKLVNENKKDSSTKSGRICNPGDCLKKKEK